MAREANEFEQNPEGVNPRTENRNRSLRRFFIAMGEERETEMTLEEFRACVTKNPEDVYNRLQQAFIGIETNENILRSEAHDLQERISSLEGQLAKAIDARDEYRNEYAVLAREYHAMRRSPTPLDRLQRSVKLPDPPLLTDGKDPKFEDWYSKMRGKLEGNADHYTTEALRMTYVESRTGGDAADHLKPRLRDGSPNKFQTAKEMLDCLKAIYLDPNRVQTAKTEFRRLVMRRADDFHQFLTRFLHLAGESELPASEYKYEFNEKLSFDLQRLVITEFHSKSSFDEFSKHCSQVAHTLRKINDTQYRTRKPATQDVSKNTPSAPRTNAPGSLNFRKEGRCYKCSEIGHIARFCTKPPATKEPEQVGKGVTLGQVSFLGNAVNCTIDLSQLLGGNAFLADCQISRNGIAVALKSLVDTGAGGYLFISYQLAEQVARRFGIQVVKLDRPVDVIGFDGKTSGQAGYVIGLHFQIAGRRFQKLPFLILDTGKQDLIVGRKFLEQHDIWLDVRNHRIIWPDDRAQAANCYIDYNINNLPTQPMQWTPTGSAREIKILRRELATPKAKPEHQADADRRDQRMEKADKRRCVRRAPMTTKAEYGSMSLKKIERVLKDSNPTIDRAPESKPSKTPSPTQGILKTDIAMMGAAGFLRNCKKPDSTLFTISLYEIDQFIEHKRSRVDQEDRELMEKVGRILPKCYHQYKH
ncbi:hypothetical protein ACJ73_09811, partial [Blastomyces percursus]